VPAPRHCFYRSIQVRHASTGLCSLASRRLSDLSGRAEEKRKDEDAPSPLPPSLPPSLHFQTKVEDIVNTATIFKGVSYFKTCEEPS